MFTKSGIMVGLGEDRQAVIQVMEDMRAADIDFLTIGQYLQPTPKHHRVDRFVTPEEFAAYEKAAFGCVRLGLRSWAASSAQRGNPLTGHPWNLAALRPFGPADIVLDKSDGQANHQN